MNARSTFAAMMCGALVAASARIGFADMITVASTNSGPGQFTYIVSGGPDLLSFGGGSNMLAIVIPSFAILSATVSPDWIVVTNDASVTLVHADSLVMYGYVAVTATIASASSGAILYDDLAVTGAYPRGWVLGDAYNSNGSLYSSAASNEAVSVNVTGYERFPLLGPVVPESATLAACVMAAIAFRARPWWCSRNHRNNNAA